MSHFWSKVSPLGRRPGCQVSGHSRKAIREPIAKHRTECGCKPAWSEHDLRERARFFEREDRRSARPNFHALWRRQNEIVHVVTISPPGLPNAWPGHRDCSQHQLAVPATSSRQSASLEVAVMPDDIAIFRDLVGLETKPRATSARPQRLILKRGECLRRLSLQCERLRRVEVPIDAGAGRFIQVGAH